MMKISGRLMKIKPSPTLTVTALANSLKAQGIDVIGFGSGEPDFDTPEFIKEAAIRAIQDGRTKYTPAGGIIELKQAVADKFSHDNNLTYATSEITINCGGKHSFYNLMQVLLDPGDEVIIPSPYWVSYPSMVELAGGEPVIVETGEDMGFKLYPDQLRRAITAKTRAFVINSPSNPTGAAYSADELSALCEVLEGTDIIIISDDIYESIIYDDFRFSNTANLSDDMKKRTIVLNGVSKTYSMTGWRIGYMAGEESVIKKVETLQSQSTSNPASISQWASVAALTGDQGCINEMMDAFTRRREMIVNNLNSIPGINCLNPAGAFYAFPGISGIFELNGWEDVSARYEGEHNSSKITSYFLEEARVAVVPGIAFGTDNHVRLSFATSDQNIREGIQRIGDAVSRLQ